MITFAVEGALIARASEISDEIENYESNARIDWLGQSAPFDETASLISNESDTVRRHDLFARRVGVIEGAQDMRAERLEKLLDAAREMGYENRLAMRRELHGLDYEKLAAQTRKILSKTENAYANALSRLIARETSVSIDDATQADLGFLQGFARFDHFLPSNRMFVIYRELFGAFGFNVEKQSNLTIDSEARHDKQHQAFCAPIRVPDEIKLVVNLTGGQANYREFLRETGHAQHYAWTSGNIYPEFRIGGDRAVMEAWGLLFENLTLDERWLMATFGFAENREFRHALSVFNLIRRRRAAALLDYEIEFHSGGLRGGAGARYAELMTDAMRVRVDETEHLRSLDDAFHSADFLRASAFEAQMREYLKTQFGQKMVGFAQGRRDVDRSVEYGATLHSRGACFNDRFGRVGFRLDGFRIIGMAGRANLMTFDQSVFDVRCEWGENGVRQLAPVSDVVIIVDALSFSTCVEVANSRRAIVFPCRSKDESAAAFAESVNAELASARRACDVYSLSPASLLNIPAGTRLALPSPNGATLSLATEGIPTLTACFRNCRAVAMAVAKYGSRIAVIPSGERWNDGSLRPAFEDWVCAGAIINHLEGGLSPEAGAARSAYRDVKSDLRRLLRQCGSGRELIERGFAKDVEIASELDVSECAPTLVDGAYINRPV